jgi:hypothetical protein
MVNLHSKLHIILLSILRLSLLLLLLVWVPVRAMAMSLTMRVLGMRIRRDTGDRHFDVVCFSHVPWNHIWQRNHHTMTRLAQQHKVLYLQLSGVAFVHVFARRFPAELQHLRSRHAAVEVRMPLLLPGESRFPMLQKINSHILAAYVRWHEWRLGMRNTVCWFYYPGNARVTELLDPMAIVYDIQDEYTAFKWSPPDIAIREASLLRKADLVFAGTHSLYTAKAKGFAGGAHFYPCAVEFTHFHGAAPASGTILEEPPEMRGLPHPRLLYMGLIDGRIDEDLLSSLAEKRPHWAIVLVGPVIAHEFDSAGRLAAQPNIYFTGQVDYNRLPQFLAHSSVYLMPWKVNELTKHINPTKTLEYLAAGRSVVSIALPDLEEFFSSCVALARSQEEFLLLCDQAVNGDFTTRIEEGIKTARSYAWESVVQDMESHIERAMEHRRGMDKSRGV